MGKYKNPYYNNSGYADPTAYEALKPLIKEEKESQNRANFLIKRLKDIIKKSGFVLLNRIELRDTKTGKEYK